MKKNKVSEVSNRNEITRSSIKNPAVQRLNKSFDQTFSKVWPPAGPPEANRIIPLQLLISRNRHRNGKILRVKQGYNPNSSSMGSIIFVLPAVLFVIAIVFGALCGLLSSLWMRKGSGTGGGGEWTGRMYSRFRRIFFSKKIKEKLK